MFGPREMLLSSEEPVVRQFLNAQRQGPIGMAEEKDADELAQEEAEGDELPPLPPIPLQLRHQRRQRRARPSASPGAWCRENGVTPPPGSFESQQRPRRRACRRRSWRRSVMSNPAVGALRQSGNLFALCLDVVRSLPRRPFQAKEFIQQAWFIASVTILPTALVSIPFGAVIALQLGNLTRQLGAQSFTGAASVLAVDPRGRARSSPRCSSPAPAARRSAPTSARARSARRSTRWRCSASTRSSAWSCPRVLASMLVAVLLNGLVSVVGVAGGYFFNVVLQGGTPGAYLASLHRARPAARPLRRRDQGAGLRRARGDRRVLQGPERRGRPEGRRRRGQPVAWSSRSCCCSSSTS